jgi:integrase
MNDEYDDAREEFYERVSAEAIEQLHAAGMDWVGFHDFRHFRASQWVMHGIDLRTVQELLGHRFIATTMRYAHFAPNHATRSVLAAYRAEEDQLRQELIAVGDKWATDRLDFGNGLLDY